MIRLAETSRSQARGPPSTRAAPIVDGVVEEYLVAARKTMDAEAAAEFERHVRGMYEQMARIVITPQASRLNERWPDEGSERPVGAESGRRGALLRSRPLRWSWC
jgi:hypothetical protein